MKNLPLYNLTPDKRGALKKPLVIFPYYSTTTEETSTYAN